jgi:putative OmpL-like beta-barrel porin-2
MHSDVTSVFLALAVAFAVLGVAGAAHAQTPPGDPPAPQEPAPPSAPVVANPLEGVTFGVGFDGYYEWNMNRPFERVNLLRAYDVSSNSFSLNQANLIVERAPDVSKGRRMGLRLDLMFGQATDVLQGSAANEARPQVYRNVFQAYGSYVFPVGRGLQVDFGKFASALGIEGNYTKDQIAYSRSFFFDFLPFYHFGFRATYAPSDRLALTYWLVNGTQQSEDFNGFKSQAGIVTIKPVPSVSWNVNYYAGREGHDLAAAVPDRSQLRIVDTYATWTKGAVQLAAEADHVEVSPDASNAAASTAKGTAVYAQYRVAPQIQLGARYEYIRDGAGLFSGQSQNLHEVTATATWQPGDGMQLRAEWRRDGSDHSFFPGPTPGAMRASQQTMTLALVWWFGSKQGTW